MDMSLDDIIKTKRIGAQPPKKFVLKRNTILQRTLNKPAFKEKPQLMDARLKIIQKNRAKIRDARDKLAEITRSGGDARQRLMQRKNLSTAPRNLKVSFKETNEARLPARALNAALRPKVRPPRSHPTNGVRPVAPALPDLITVPRGYVDYDNMERMEEEEYAVATRLSRTVKNDINNFEQYKRPEALASLPTRRVTSWPTPESPVDPFDVYEMPLPRRERRISPDLSLPAPKSILRPTSQHSSGESFQRRFAPETTHLSYEMRSRLERAPDPHASMGIFSNPLKTVQNSMNGFRIVVSNLHTSVTQSDIQELFEDIGPLYDSRLVRPGIAEVVYKELSDAEKAVDTYHNRKLDGQPMKCLLVNPRASNKPTAPAIKTSSSSNYASGKSPVEIDIDALHKVLFQRH